MGIALSQANTYMLLQDPRCIPRCIQLDRTYGTSLAMSMSSDDNFPTNVSTSTHCCASSLTSKMNDTRRSFLAHIITTSFTLTASTLLTGNVATAALTTAKPIKVTPLAHTFITTGSGIYPVTLIRGNDATRFLPTHASFTFLMEIAITPVKVILRRKF